ncbi:MAG TPA: AAA family ATPase, partial [Vicinamibacterales bacterium]|nr:AAA family ATPase [Vicinamibacterales bacterium]
MTFEIAELLAPECYPHPVDGVEVVQTHISIVCLAGDRVYKLKKPVTLPFLDFGTPALREHFCREELRLNRRLCPDIYLDVVPLCRGPRGLNFRGEGAVIDHAVLMVRLPADRMLDRLLARDAVTPAEIDRLAHVVAAFHRDADRGERVRAAGAPAHLAAQLRANFTDSAPYVGTLLDAALHAALARAAERDLASLLPRLEQRAAAGYVVDGHGDLHARNVCLTDPPAIYDCIEFSEAFRCGDTATEIAFMAMDLRYRGHRPLAERFVASYAAAAGDAEVPALMPPLVRYRALVRMKVAAMAASDHALPPDDREAAGESARRHLRLAAATVLEDQGACWIAACGPPASGKSHLLGALAREAGWPILQSDVIRKELAGVAPTTRLPASAYGESTTDRTYDTMLARAAATSGVMLLDATWPTRRRRDQLRAAAARAGAQALVVQLDVPPEVARERLRLRASDPRAVSDADETVFERLARRFEPATPA